MKSSLTRTDLNLWLAFVDEAKTQRLYAAYALQAMSEGHPEAAEAFMEAAGSEVVHAMVHLQAVGAVGSTIENLRRVVEEEAREVQIAYPRYIEEARREGRQDAIRAFVLALEREQHHIALFAQTLDALQKKIQAGGATPAAFGSGVPFFKRASPDGASVAERTPAVPSEAIAQIAEQQARGNDEPQPARVAIGGLERMSGPAEVADERARIARRSRIRELVFGAQDGLLTTVAVVSSFFGASASKPTILFAGVATGIAGMLAMTAGSYLSSKAAKDVERSEVERELREIKEHPAEELAELVEIYRTQGMPAQQAKEAALKVAHNPKRMLEVMTRAELGLDAHSKGNPLADAGVMALSFMVGSIIPILPYALPFFVGPTSLAVSILITGIALFSIGVIKARAADTSPLRSGMEAFIIGAGAGLLGWVVGTYIPSRFGVNFVPG